MSVNLPTVEDVQLLLDSLSAGADQPLYSADDWLPRLGDRLFAQAFAAQLGREWRPATPPDALCQQIADEVRAYLAAAHFGWPHLWAHTLRVTGYALELAGEAQIDQTHAFLLGVLHDVGKLDELQTGVAHELTGGLLARKWLLDRLPAQIVERIASTISKRNKGNSDPFIDLLHDSDKLDKVGATGIARRLSTDFGAQHIRMALRIVAADVSSFPEMHFPTSKALADSKLEFSKTFLDQVRSVVSWL